MPRNDTPLSNVQHLYCTNKSEHTVERYRCDGSAALQLRREASVVLGFHRLGDQYNAVGMTEVLLTSSHIPQSTAEGLFV